MPRTKAKKPKTEASELPPPSPGKVNARLQFWRWPILTVMMLGLSLIMLLALWTSFFDLFGGLEYRIRNLLIAYVSTRVDKQFYSRKISIILVDQNEPRDAPPGTPFGQATPAHRHYHAQLLNALAGKASVVVFDMEFKTPAPDPKVDEELAAAIEFAERAGTRILVGVDVDESDPKPIINPALRSALKDHWGIFEGQPSGGSSSTYFVRLGLPVPNQPEPDFGAPEQLLVPALALKAVEHLRYPNQNLQAFFNARTNRVSVRPEGVNGQIMDAIPVDNKIYMAVDLAGKDNQGPRNRYHNVYATGADLSEFVGKIVVVGYQAGDEQKVSETEVRYGAEIQANAISNMLLGSYIGKLSIGYEYLIILTMIVVGALMRLEFASLANYKLPFKLPFGMIDKSIDIPVTLLSVVLLYLFVAILAYKFERKVFNVPYGIAALGLSYLSIGAVRPYLGLK